METTKPSVAILGAGLGGMAAAYDLVRQGRKVTIYEAADYVGGLASVSPRRASGSLLETRLRMLPMRGLL